MGASKCGLVACFPFSCFLFFHWSGLAPARGTGYGSALVPARLGGMQGSSCVYFLASAVLLAFQPWLVLALVGLWSCLPEPVNRTTERLMFSRYAPACFSCFLSTRLLGIASTCARTIRSPDIPSVLFFPGYLSAQVQSCPSGRRPPPPPLSPPVPSLTQASSPPIWLSPSARRHAAATLRPPQPGPRPAQGHGHPPPPLQAHPPRRRLPHRLKDPPLPPR